MNDVAAVILAAGLASRYRAADPAIESKVVALLAGKPLVRHVAETALAARLSPVVVVTGHADSAVRKALEGLDVQFVHNADYAGGMAGSLKAGVAVLPATVSGAFVMLADMPRVTVSTIENLRAALKASPDADAIVPVAQGRRGNPALLARSLFPAVSQLTGDEGARRILANPAVKVVEVEADADVVVDIDTPDALKDAQRQL